MAIWDSRNVFIYGSPISYSEVSYRQALMKDVLSLHSALALIADPTTDSWCFIAPNILRAQPLLSLRQWLRRARARLHGPPSSPLLSLHSHPLLFILTPFPLAGGLSMYLFPFVLLKVWWGPSVTAFASNYLGNYELSCRRNCTLNK